MKNRFMVRLCPSSYGCTRKVAKRERSPLSLFSHPSFKFTKSKKSITVVLCNLNPRRRTLKRHTWMEFDRLSETSPEKDYGWWLMSLHRERKSFSESRDGWKFKWMQLKMTSAQDVETSVSTNSTSQDSFHPHDQIPSNYVTPGFNHFLY